MGTRTTSFGVGRREAHDASRFYGRGLSAFVETADVNYRVSTNVDKVFLHSSEHMGELEDNSVALMITSPPYHVGKDYDSDRSFGDYLELMEAVFAETYRKLEPGGRAVVNVANLGRKPYIPLTHKITERMLKIGYAMRGEIIWVKGKGANGNCAWGTWRSPKNPVVRDVHEYCLCFSKGRFERVRQGEATISAPDFMDATLSVWEIRPESAKKVGHPAPFPVELPKRFIQFYTYRGDLVLDPFIGSGATAVAAVELDRRWVGYEVSPEYASATTRRAQQAGAATRIDQLTVAPGTA